MGLHTEGAGGPEAAPHAQAEGPGRSAGADRNIFKEVYEDLAAALKDATERELGLRRVIAEREAEARAKADELAVELTRARIALEEARAQKDALASRLADGEARWTRLQDNATALERRQRRTAAELAELSAEAVGLRTQLAEAEQRASAAEADRTAAERLIEDLRRELETERTAAARARSEMERSAAEAAKRIAELELERRSAEDQLISLKSQLNQQRAHADDAWARAEQAERELANAAAENRSALLRADEAENRAAALERRLTDLGEVLAAERRSLTERLAALEAELKSRAERSERDYSAASSQLETERLRAKAAETRAASLEQHLTSLAQNLDERLATERELRARVADLEQLRGALSAAEADLAHYRAAVDALRGSASWRVTAPLRGTTRAIRALPRGLLRLLLLTRVLTIVSRLLRRANPSLWRRLAGPVAARVGRDMPLPPPAPRATYMPPATAKPSHKSEIVSADPEVRAAAEKLSALIQTYRLHREEKLPG